MINSASGDQSKGVKGSSIILGPKAFYWLTKSFSHFNIFNYWIMHNSLNNSIYLYRYFDKGLLQYLGPFGI